jgi:hypothetical protein
MIVAGFVLIVLDRVLPERTVFTTAYPHDENLMKSIRLTYSPGLDHFLRTHAFGNGSFKADVLNPLDRFRSMRGAQSEFIDDGVNDAWRRVRQAAQTLMREVAEKTVPAHRSDRITPFRDNKNQDWHSDEMIERCKVLDDAADQFVEEWDRFDALARRQIPHAV